MVVGDDLRCLYIVISAISGSETSFKSLSSLPTVFIRVESVVVLR